MDDPRTFSGNAAELANRAIEHGLGYGLPVDPDKTNERLVRYYVSEGVLDKPDRVGREAAYGYRHLLQLLTARRMAQAGMSLAVIAQHNRSALTRALEEGLDKPLPTQAELLVGSFMQRKPSASRTASSSPAPSPVSRPSMALPDVLDEVRRFKEEVITAMEALRRDRAPVRRSPPAEGGDAHRLPGSGHTLAGDTSATQGGQPFESELLVDVRMVQAGQEAKLLAVLAESQSRLESSLAEVVGRVTQIVRESEHRVLQRLHELQARQAEDTARLRDLIEGLQAPRHGNQAPDR